MCISLLFEDLPNIFLRAFNVAEELQYRYIWIGALCVLQDNEEELLQGLPTVGKVYQHCDLNITATSANDLLACSWKFDKRHTPNDTMYVRLSTYASTVFRMHEVIRDNVWCKDVVQSPLAHNAGYFQHQVFAPRKLRFVGKQVYWDKSLRSISPWTSNTILRRLCQ